MTNITVTTMQPGLVGVNPSVAYIDTSNTLTEVSAVGFLNKIASQGAYSFNNKQMVLVYTTDVGVQWMQVIITPGNISLQLATSAGQVTLPTILNHIAVYGSTGGALTEDASTAINGGNIQAGLSGTAGYLASFPATAANGSLRVQAANAGADFNTIISNASSIGQNQTISIPDAGASTANFLLDAGASNILSQQQFVGLSNILSFSAGTWTTTRIAAGNYASVKSQASETAIIGIDITPMIRTAASKGFKLNSFDVIYGIATLALNSHSVSLSLVNYANNSAVNVTSVPLTATLATATQGAPYVTNAAVNSPAFDITTDSKYVVEITLNAAATSDYSFYGIVLKFSQTVA